MSAPSAKSAKSQTAASPARSHTPLRGYDVKDPERALGNRAIAALFEATPQGGQSEREAANIAASPLPQASRVSPVTGADPLPAGVREAAEHSSGGALPRSVRSAMEYRFGADFGSVRVHAGEAARRVTDGLSARAVTIGAQIFFNDAFDAGDRVLLSHELAHVLQQRAGAAARIQRAPKKGTQKAVEATTEDKRQFLQESVRYLHDMADFYRTKARIALTSKTKDKVDPARLLPPWKKAIDGDLDIITALGGDAALRKDLKAAYDDMVQSVMALAAQSESIQLHEAYQKYRDHIHELGWPEASVETDANTLSDAIPKDERSRIKVISTTTVDVPGKFNLDELFKKKFGSSFSPPEGTEVVFSGAVQEDFKKGLTSIGAGLITQLKPPVLKLNSTISLAIDLGKYGGDYALYRFTYYAHTVKKKTTNQLVIERLGKVGMEGLRATAQEAANKKFKAHHLEFVGTWEPAQQEHVLAAVNLIPDNILSIVDGVKFARAKKGPKDEAGNYSLKNPDHTITLFDKAFDKSSVRFGMPGPGLASPAAYDASHEIGHAIDRAKVRAALGKEKAAKAALKAKFGQYEVSPDQYELNNVPLPVLKEFNELMGKATKAGKETETTVTESGMRFQPKAGSTETELQDDPKAKSKFKEADKAAGSVRISPYSEDAWEEYFAESFALFVTDPATLKRLRPKLFEFFEDKFDESKKKKKK